MNIVPKGKWTLEYTVRINNEGVFQLPPTRVEALYCTRDVRRDTERESDGEERRVTVRQVVEC